jgi:CBS domain-containing protein
VASSLSRRQEVSQLRTFAPAIPLAYSLQNLPLVSDAKSALRVARLDRPITAVMRRHWISTSPQLSLYEAELLMRVAGIRQVPVISDDTLVGVLGHRDLLRAALERILDHPLERAKDLLATLRVAEVMDRQPPTALPSESLLEVARRMVAEHLGCLPVVEKMGDRVLMVGLVVESDLLRLAYAPAGTAGS